MPVFADDQQFKEEVRTRTDIVALISESVTLHSQRGGREFKGLCPFHEDRNPSFMVYPDRQSFKCWPCDLGGDCFAFVMRRDNVSFREALEMLAQRANMEMPKRRRPEADGGAAVGESKNRLYEIVAWAENEFHECLLKSAVAERARHYLKERGISANSMSRFRLGYHPDNWQWLIERARGKYTPQQLALVKLAGERDGNNGFFDYFADRLMFPIRDAQRRPVAFGGRVLPGGPPTEMGKYWNSPEYVLFQKSRMLYALDHARDSISKSKTVVVTEGYTDCITAHQYGLTNFVASLGTALNENHVTHLKRFAQRVVLVLDGDDAGKNAAEKALTKFLAQEIDLRIVTLPDNLDPADFLIQRGKDQLQPILDGAVEAWDYKLRLTIDRYGLDSIDSKNRVLTDMLEVLSQVPLQAGVGLGSNWQLRESVIIGGLSQELKISETIIREKLNELRTVHQQKNGTGAQFRPYDDDAESQHTVDRSFPQNPTRDERAERELLEVIFAIPEQVGRIREEITPADFTNPHLRELLEVCFEMHDQGTLPSYDRVTARLEDAGLKNLATDVDLHGRELGISPKHLEQTLKYYRDRRDQRQSFSIAVDGPHGPATGNEDESPVGLDPAVRERLRQATEKHRKVQQNRVSKINQQ
ncbi:MAG TPA: DNA primase [Planctomycetaceae bacterium]